MNDSYFNIKNYFKFKGRLNRKPYWLMLLILMVVMVTLMIVLTVLAAPILSDPSFDGFSPTSLISIILFGILYIVFFITSISLAIRRLHDRNKSGWWILLFYIGPSILLGLSNALVFISTFLMSISYLVSIGISIWGFIEIGFLKGTTGPNRFGPDPLSGASVDPSVFD